MDRASRFVLRIHPLEREVINVLIDVDYAYVRLS
jgi:hypothetical protein